MKALLTALLITLLTATSMLAARLTDFTSSNSVNTPLKMVVDAVETRDDLTRVYAHVEGMPHSSCRIDAIVMEINGKSLAATDIDGVDFKRYFQWEDTPFINLEIDFPAIKTTVGSFTLKTTTPRGEAVTKVTKK